MSDTPRVLFTLTGGGYLWEAKQLINGLSSNVEYLYVTTSDSMHPSFEEIPRGQIYSISKVTTLSERGTLKKIANLCKSLAQSIGLLRKIRPDLVVCVASSIAVPLCVCARLLGIKAVFVESVTRVNGLSTTGEIIRKLRLCENIYVQWPNMAAPQKGIIYAGTVL